MKRLFKMVTLLLTLPMGILPTDSSHSKKGNKTPSLQSSVGAPVIDRTFTLEELKKYDGKNGSPAYAAVNGIVYDVTNLKTWHNGYHVQDINAGTDLSSVMGMSPHGNDILQDVPIVGKL